MTKTVTSNHFFGDSAGGVVGGGCCVGCVGVKAFSGMWCDPFTTGLSPTTIRLIPIIGAAGAAFVAGTKGCVGVCAVRVARSAGTALGLFDCGVFFGGAI
jgi:hypothetical protein